MPHSPLMTKRMPCEVKQRAMVAMATPFYAPMQHYSVAYYICGYTKHHQQHHCTPSMVPTRRPDQSTLGMSQCSYVVALLRSKPSLALTPNKSPPTAYGQEVPPLYFVVVWMKTSSVSWAAGNLTPCSDISGSRLPHSPTTSPTPC